ncbi:MAG: hypothetical protein KAU49_01575 [Candidatus Krumholzibacteria bacterium]|nr:hypothetical protein [Candidatus Krumholzibacteria bacterium]
MKRIIIQVLIITSAAHVGCTHIVNVPDSEWEVKEDKFDPPRNYRDGELIFSGDYIFHLTDGSTLSPSRFTRTDSTFIILEIYTQVSHTELDDPIVLPFDEVDHIEKISAWWWPTKVLLVAIGGTVAFIAFLGYMISSTY